MRRAAIVIVALSLGLAAAVGCKSEQGVRKSDTEKPYEPPPRTRQAPPDAAPAPTDERVDEDASVAQCVRECVQQSQMRAEAPESIRAGCVQTCSERCAAACVERAERRGERDEGTEQVCKKTCSP